MEGKNRWIFSISTTNPVGIFLRAKTCGNYNDSAHKCSAMPFTLRPM